MKIDSILNLNQHFKQCVDKPTRLSPPAIIDVIISDLHEFYQSPYCEPPLEVDSDKIGSPSNHLMVVMNPLNAIDNKKIRNKKTIKIRAFTDEAFVKMETMLNSYNWSNILEDKSPDKIHLFHKEVYNMFENCFSLKTKTFLNENKPFFTDKLVKLKRKKTREFNRNRKSRKYETLAKIYDSELKKAKKLYYRKHVLKLRSKKPKEFIRSIRKMIDPEKDEEVIEVDDIRHLSDNNQAELIADRFAEVSCEYQPLNRDEIIFPHFNSMDIPVLSESDVLQVLFDMDCSKATRQSDIPAKIFKRFAKVLHKPLTSVINDAIKQGYWPDFLKLEIVTPIPKINNPKILMTFRI